MKMKLFRISLGHTVQFRCKELPTCGTENIFELQLQYCYFKLHTKHIYNYCILGM